MTPMFNTDGYKLDHRRQYPKGTERVYSNWTARGSRVRGVHEVVFLGLQYAIKERLEKDFNENFFNSTFSRLPLLTILGSFSRGILKSDFVPVSGILSRISYSPGDIFIEPRS